MSVTATSNVNIIQVIPPDKTIISAVIPEAGYVVVVDNVRTGPRGVGVADNGIAGQFLISNGGSNTYWSNLEYSLFEDSGVIANTYGNSSSIPVITVNAKGIVTNLYTTSSISLNNFTYSSSNNTFTAENSNGQIFNATINSVNTFAITNATSNVAVFLSNGNVGIGTTTPQVPLQVDGSFRFASDGSNYLQFQRNASNNWKLTSNGVGDVFTIVGNLLTIPQNVTIQREGLDIERTLVSSSPALDIYETWNNSSITFTASKINITDTASDANSLLVNYQKNSNSVFKLYKSGEIRVNDEQGDYQGMKIIQGYDSTSFSGVTNSFRKFTFSTAVTFGMSNIDTYIRGDALLGWSTSTNSQGTLDFGLHRDVSISNTSVTGILAQRNSTNPQTYRIYGTYTDDSNFERLSLSSNSTASYITSESFGNGSVKDFIISGGGNTKEVKLYSGSDGKVVLETAGNQSIDILPDANQLYIHKKQAAGNTFSLISSMSANSSGSFGFYTKTDSETNYSTLFESGGSYTKQFIIRAGGQAGGQVGTDVYIYSGMPGTNTLRAGNMYIYAAESGGSGAPGNIILQSNGTTNYSGNVGIGNTSPAAKLHVQGNSLFTDTITVGNSSVNTTVNSTSFSGLSALNEPLFATIRYVSNNDNINNTDNVIIASNTITLSLPNATGINGRKYVVKNVGNGVITVVGSSGQLIDGYPNLIITGAYSALTLLSNNSGWYIY